MSDQLCGGLEETRLAYKKIQDLCDKMKPEVEKKLGKKFKEFTAVSYRSQVVAGFNYFIKVNVGDNTHVHIRVWEKLYSHGGGHELSAVEHPKSLEDPIKYFP